MPDSSSDSVSMRLLVRIAGGSISQEHTSEAEEIERGSLPPGRLWSESNQKGLPWLPFGVLKSI